MRKIAEIPYLMPRRRDAYKGDFGKILILAGSSGMMGAACLTTEACIRSGAGLVTLGVPASLLPIAMTKLTCATVLPFPEPEPVRTENGWRNIPQGVFGKLALDSILTAAREFDVVVLGPGIGNDYETIEMVCQLVPALDKPLVLDADGLNAIALHTSLLAARQAPTIITPHPGEFSRLTGCGIDAVKKNKVEYAAEFAKIYNCVVALKTVPTIVTDGEQYYQNLTGNPGMARGGSGDVLTGVIAALLGQKMQPFQAAVLGVYIHGLAGNLARDAKGEIGMNAEDIVECLPKAFIWQPVSYNI